MRLDGLHMMIEDKISQKKRIQDPSCAFRSVQKFVG